LLLFQLDDYAFRMILRLLMPPYVDRRVSRIRCYAIIFHLLLLPRQMFAEFATTPP